MKSSSRHEVYGDNGKENGNYKDYKGNIGVILEYYWGNVWGLGEGMTASAIP